MTDDEGSLQERRLIAEAYVTVGKMLLDPEGTERALADYYGARGWDWRDRALVLAAINALRYFPLTDEEQQRLVNFAHDIVRDEGFGLITGEFESD